MSPRTDRIDRARETARSVDKYVWSGATDPRGHERLYQRIVADIGLNQARYFDEFGDLPYETHTSFPVRLPLPWPVRTTTAARIAVLRAVVALLAAFGVGFLWPQLEGLGTVAEVAAGIVGGCVGFAAATLVLRLLPTPKDIEQRRDAVARWDAMQQVSASAAEAQAVERRAARMSAASGPVAASEPPAGSADPADRLAALSSAIDAHNARRDPEAILWGRVAKVAEEAGEVVGALVGVTGQNPRKGVSHTQADLVDELLDTAAAALGAVEHLTENRGYSMRLLAAKIARVHERALSVPLHGFDDDVDDAQPVFAELTPVSYVGDDEAIAARFAAHQDAQGRGSARSTLVIFDDGADYLSIPTEHLRAA